MIPWLKSLMATKITLTPADLLTQTKYDRKLPRLIQDALRAKTLLAIAESRGLVFSADELQQAADQLRVKYDLYSAKETLDWLNRYCLSVEDFENLAYRQLVYDRLLAEITDEQIAVYFASHQLDYRQAIIYVVTFADQALAMELFYAWQEREIDFLSIVANYGNAKGNSQKIHQLIQRKDVPPELSAAIFATQPPTLLRPIVYEKKTNLIYVLELIAPTLTEQLQQQIRGELFEQWVIEQQKNLEVVLPQDWQMIN